MLLVNERMVQEKEILRLKILDEYKILDTLPEQMYDDITTMAASICNAPIALITLVDKHRQFFKSHYGIDINQTPIEDSVCSHAIQSGAPYFEITDLRKDSRFKDNRLVTGEPKIVSYFGVPLESDEKIPFGTLSIITTEVLQLSELQRKALMSLAKQVVYLLELRKKNFLLDSYQEKLENHSINMKEFAFIAAHDLRSPLRSINSFLKLLESKNSDLWDEKDRQYFGFIFENVQRMDKLVIDLLDLAKCHMNHPADEKVNLHELISGIFEAQTKANTEQQAQLTLNKLPEITSSGIALTIVFQNLIANALKYQPKGNTAKIEISGRETEKQWIITVKDNGIGIEQDHLPAIFEPFKRLHTQSEFSGSGLGLTACKKIIENLKGTISVTSENNKGTVFTIELPKQQA